MDLIQRARELYVSGRMHDALEAAQAACDRSPRDSEAWWLLGRISRHTGLPAASDVAFRRAAELDGSIAPPHRVSPERFQALVGEARSALADDVRDRLARTSIRVQLMPTAEQVRAGVDPDALRLAEGPPPALILFQVNHENRSATERELRELLGRSLTPD